jgi:hypothetical protein
VPSALLRLAADGRLGHFLTSVLCECLRCAKAVATESRILRINIVNRDTGESTACIDGGMNSAWAELGYSLTKVTMLITLVAVLCNGQLCLEKIVTTSDQSGITMTACMVHAQIDIAEWLAHGPYHEWKLQRYKCVMGKYIPKSEA